MCGGGGGGWGKHACFFTSEYIKTTRGKIKKNNRLVFILSRVVLICSLV